MTAEAANQQRPWGWWLRLLIVVVLSACVIFAITAIDRVGNASPARVMEIQQNPTEKRILLKR